MASLSTCHLGLWLGWQILLNLVKSAKLPCTVICACQGETGCRNEQSQAAASFAGDEDSDDNELGIVVRANLHIHVTNFHIIISSLT